jgi:RNA polymerase sigma factor (sigma-70 family)
VDAADDEELVELTPVQPYAFAVFYRRYERAVLGYFMRRTGDPEIAADLAAETFAAALDGVRRFDRSRAPAVAWLFGIAQHKLLRAWKKGRVEDAARRRLEMPVLELEDSALERISVLGGDERVADLLSRLPADQAQAIRARIIDEQPYARIAAEIRCSESVARQRVSRGLAKLRAIVEEES